METEEDQRALAAYLEVIEQAQAMDWSDVRRRAAGEFDTERIADRAIAVLGRVRESTVDDGRRGIASPQPQISVDEHVVVGWRLDQRSDCVSRHPASFDLLAIAGPKSAPHCSMQFHREKAAGREGPGGMTSSS